MSKFTKAKKLRSIYNPSHPGRIRYRSYDENTPEINKWIAGDFIRLIGMNYDVQTKGVISDISGLNETILQLHRNLHNMGLEGVDENMSEEERERIYWKKLWVWYYWKTIDHYKNRRKETERTNSTYTINDDYDEDYQMTKQVMWEETDEKQHRDIAMFEAIMELVEEKKMDMVNVRNQSHLKMTRQKMADFIVNTYRMYYGDRLTHKQIAAKVGCSSETVRVTVNNTTDYVKRHKKQLMNKFQQVYERMYGIN